MHDQKWLFKWIKTRMYYYKTFLFQINAVLFNFIPSKNTAKNVSRFPHKYLAVIIIRNGSRILAMNFHSLTTRGHPLTTWTLALHYTTGTSP